MTSHITTVSRFSPYICKHASSIYETATVKLSTNSSIVACNRETSVASFMCQQEYKSSSVKSVYVQHVKRISVKTGAVG